MIDEVISEILSAEDDADKQINDAMDKAKELNNTTSVKIEALKQQQMESLREEIAQKIEKANEKAEKISIEELKKAQEEAKKLVESTASKMDECADIVVKAILG